MFVKRHVIEDTRWTKEFKERIGEQLLQHLHNAISANIDSVKVIVKEE